ncbi:MAG: efflux RND transporter periplasmic adaptor subunit [Proteobacteria bacterium]|jgi:HlyD family secretion protein|nr:efflux RND transporter periplasmic adaptor subunit [Pseudomonadota bacterium]
MHFSFHKWVTGLGVLAACGALSGCNLEISEKVDRLTAAQRDAAERPLTGLIGATEIDVASKVPGRILKVHVHEGDSVVEGQELVELNLDELDAKLLQATSAIDAARAQLKLAEKGARPQEKKAAANQVEAAQAQVDVTKKMLDRSRALLDENAIPQAKFDEIEFKYNVSVSQLEMAQAKYDAISKGARSEEIQALEALVAKGESVAAEIEIYKKEVIQKSPIKGEISKVALHEGELTSAGYPIITIVNMDDMWASFAVREDRLKNLRKGDKVDIYIPALDRYINMTITYISPMADFATWRATSDRDSFDLKSFEVKLKPAEPVDGLRPGMTARWINK